MISLPAKGKVEVKGRKVFGCSQEPENFGTYFVLELDRDITSFGTFENDAVKTGDSARDGKNIGAYINFSTDKNRVVAVKVGTSTIGYEQAELNLQREVGAQAFDGVRKKTAATWEKEMGRIEIKGGTDDQRKTFYTCLYRALKFPHRMYELDQAGKAVHRSPYDSKMHDGVLYADNGFWDTYRCVYSFYSVAYPEQWKDIMQGWVQAYRENGWYPQWPSPGNRSCMIGTHIDAVIADAIVKGMDGLDVQTAYEGLHKDAFVNPTDNNRGRQALDKYLKLGFVPNGACEYAMSSSLDYAYDDWCVAQAAKKLGKMDDYAVLMERANNYRKSWDPSIGFMRAKTADGQWLPNFDEFAWGGPYVEGGPWQCSWAVQQDVAGLIGLVGGPEAMVAKLDKMFATPPTFHTGGYGGVIHEMSEMPPVNAGQYAHGNQPVHHVLYLYAAAGQPWKTEQWTRKMCATVYNAGPKGFAGDEDNGEMATWYLLNAMGFYPLTPGCPEYMLTSPVFEKATIHLAHGKNFTVSASHNSDNAVYVQNRSLNGRDYTKTWISHEDVINGAKIQVEMGVAPKVRDVKIDELPYSMSTDTASKAK